MSFWPGANLSFVLRQHRLLSSCQLIIRPFSLSACHSVWALTRGAKVTDGSSAALSRDVLQHTQIFRSRFSFSLQCSISLSISFLLLSFFFIHLTTSQGWQIACERLNLERLRPHVYVCVCVIFR